MNKRPLCMAAVCWAVLLWLLGQAGISFFTYAPPMLPLQASASGARVTGIVYRVDCYSYSTNLYLKKTNLILNSKKYPIDRIKVTVKNEKTPEKIKPGCEVLVKGDLQEIPLPSNPGQFHERAYYYPRKIKWYQEASGVEVTEPEKDKFLCVQAKLKERLKKGIYSTVSEKKAGILEAMLLGDKGNIGTENKFLFQLMGCSHILAVSGTHLSVIGGLLFGFLRKIRIPYKTAGGMTVLSMGFYGSLTGNGAAILRAVIMFAVSVGAFWTKRTYDFLSAAALSAILLLLESPLYLYDSSFLLSFGAILGLGSVFPVLFSEKAGEKRGESRKEKLCRGIAAGLQLGISVWLVLLPVVMYFFYEIPVWGIFINLLILPTAGILLTFGLLGCLLGMVFPLFGRIVMLPAAGILEIYLDTGKLAAYIPGALWITGQPKLWKCAGYYVLLSLGLFWKCKKERQKRKCEKDRKRREELVLWGMLTGACLLLLIRLPGSGVIVTFLDVGQGDCACIQTDAHSGYLIDGGSSTVSGVGTYRILPFLKASGIRKIKGIFVSHMDDDHVNGILELLESIEKRKTSLRVERIFLSACRETEEKRRELERVGKAAGCEILYAEKGTCIKDKSVVLECLSPSGKYRGDWESNEASQVWRVQSRGFSILFTGDVQERGEKGLLGETGKCQVLKVAHHGSKNSTPEEFLKEVKPEAAVLSCGEENQYGHPHRELLERLEKYAGQIYNTAEVGAVGMEVGKGKIKIFCYRERES